MINPNTMHLIRNCEILSIDSFDGWMVFKCPNGHKFDGRQKYGKDTSFKIGQRVNIRVSYSITGGQYIAWKVTKIRNRKKESK